MTATLRCQCGHGPSRHYHTDGSKACRLCTACRTYRPRCTATVYRKGWPETCSRNAVDGTPFCRQHNQSLTP